MQFEGPQHHRFAPDAALLQFLCSKLWVISFWRNPAYRVYLDEMVVFLQDELQIRSLNYSISRALTSIGWSKEPAQQKAEGRNPDL
ncbi:hypothetical protein GX50_07065 [[Emmonsia] crescens]|uniref:Uncharacterized protein n=1 Tax=[Emmonsia] crescens TaxID=73230 RepID=A0A2B7Z9A8_9EURO|nr:hypothetical protein GX50_07065 [Emmonsia crescens]